jgi:peptidase E
MAAEKPTILATSMGLNRARDPWVPGPVFRYAADLARPTGTPRLCVLTTAGGDQRDTIARFKTAFANEPIDVSMLTLFDKPGVDDLAAHLHAHDIIWVDRGSMVNLLAVWRAHGLDTILRECWEAGVVLGGESAGSLCWFTAGTSDSFGPVQAIADGLGFLPYSNAVHYRDRRDLFHQVVGDGEFPTGYATDAGAGLHFEGTDLVTAISDRANAAAYQVIRNANGTAQEKELDVRRLKRE